MIEIINWTLIVLNLAGVIWWHFALRKTLILNRVLIRLVLDAFFHRHLPIWVPWAVAFHKRIEMTVSEEEWS